MNKYMEISKDIALKGAKKGEGGPFGAIVVDKYGKIISRANNMVLKNNDPTAHAEIVAIRKACKKLKSYDLEGCILYTSCEPCPMCLSAIIWSNIKEIYYGANREDAARIGFRDNDIYEYLKEKKPNMVKLKQVDREECIKIFNIYNKKNKIIY